MALDKGSSSSSAGTSAGSLPDFAGLPIGATYRLDAEFFNVEDLDGVGESVLGSGNLNHLVLQSELTNSLADATSASANALVEEMLSTADLPAGSGSARPTPTDEATFDGRLLDPSQEDAAPADGAFSGQRGFAQPTDLATLIGGSHTPGAGAFKQQARLAQAEVLLLTEGASADAISGCVSLDVRCRATVKELLDTLASLLTGAAGAVPVPCDAAPAPQPAPEPTAQPQQKDRPNILIVDDDRDLVRGLKIRLRNYDVEVATESGGRDALYTALRIKPDVIVTDYSMPEGDAEYFLLRLKEEAALRDVPIIVMTGWSFDGGPDVAHERDMLGRCGVSVYLRKPIDFPILLAELERHVPMRSKAKAIA